MRDVGSTELSIDETPMDSLFLFSDWLGTPAWLWLLFIAAIVTLLAIDLGVFNREERAIGIRKSIVLSTFYIVLGLAFGIVVWLYLGPDSGMEYLTGFAIEKALALDNVFVIAIIFTYFAVPASLQHRVLFWGVVGAIALRAILIGLGATIVAQFAWVLYIFAIFLIVTGIKMLVIQGKSFDVGKNPFLAFLRKHANVTDEYRGNSFFVRKETAAGATIWFMTPLSLHCCSLRSPI